MCIKQRILSKTYCVSYSKPLDYLPLSKWALLVNLKNHSFLADKLSNVDTGMDKVMCGQVATLDMLCNGHKVWVKALHGHFVYEGTYI